MLWYFSFILYIVFFYIFFFFFQAEDGIRDGRVTGVQTCALPIYLNTWQNYLPSLDPNNSPTILLDYDTGELIEHFAEVDVSLAPNNQPVAPPTDRKSVV